MNRDYIVWNLRETSEQLATLTRELEGGGSSEPEFYVAVAHLYHHINTAWNARNASEPQIQECSAEDFKELAPVR